MMWKQFALSLFLIIFVVVSRITPHPENLVPVTAVFLLAGARLPYRWQGWAVPLAAMLISDWIIGFYPGMWSVYLCYLAFPLIGWILRKTDSPVKIASGSLVCSTLFFLITNAICWYGSSVYTQNLSGLKNSYIAGLPFFRNSLLGDLTWTLIVFGVWSLATHWLHNRKLAMSHEGQSVR